MTYKKQPRGYFEKFMVADCETSGLFLNNGNPATNEDGEYYQPLSWGLIVVDARTFKPIEELYVEIKYDGKALWNDGAQKVHGMSQEYLEENGVDEEDAVVQIAEMILKTWGPDMPVCFAGHNVGTFDVPFMREMMLRHGVPLRFGNRHIDSFSAGFVTLGTYNSDDLFEMVGCTERGEHNALEDARNTLRALQVIKATYDQCTQ